MHRMQRSLIRILVLCLAGLLTTAASAQNATFSLEAVAVNSTPLPAGPARQISVLPGDVITLKVFLRDWSPDGEELKAYQAKLDRDGYTSGLAGKIMPVDFDDTTGKGDENKANCFIDRDEPQYIYTGLKDLSLTDTRSFGYRWLGILLNAEDTRVALQDSVKFYCGTVHMHVSDDADGSFTLRLHTGPQHSSLRDPDNTPIIPLDFEDVIVDVKSDTLRAVSSNPPSGAIGSHWALNSASRATYRSRGRQMDKPGGWDRIEFTFSGDTRKLSAADFAIDDGSANPPGIKKVISRDTVLMLVLSRGVSPGRWTTIVHSKSGTGTRIGFLPGDVNADGAADSNDLLALMNQSYAAEPLPDDRADMDRDGHTGISDVLRVLDILTEQGAYLPARLDVE